jgi:hypothetical protein
MNETVKSLAATLVLAAAALPLGAFAQTAPVPPPASGTPSYSRPSYASDEETIAGRITAFDGGYKLEVRDDRGFVDRVELHPGTIINPTGIRLQPGMSVTIYGVNRGPMLAADEIDTPYQQYGVIPYYPYDPRIAIGIGIGPRWGRWR